MEQKTISITREQAVLVLAAIDLGVICANALEKAAKGDFKTKDFEENKDRLLKAVDSAESVSLMVRDFLTKKMKELSDGSPRD